VEEGVLGQPGGVEGARGPGGVLSRFDLHARVARVGIRDWSGQGVDGESFISIFRLVGLKLEEARSLTLVSFCSQVGKQLRDVELGWALGAGLAMLDGKLKVRPTPTHTLLFEFSPTDFSLPLRFSQCLK